MRKSPHHRTRKVGGGMSLLEKAKKVGVKIKRNRSPQDIELALAWLKDEVMTVQVQEVLGCSGGTALYYLSKTLKQAFKEGWIKINANKPRN